MEHLQFTRRNGYQSQNPDMFDDLELEWSSYEAYRCQMGNMRRMATQTSCSSQCSNMETFNSIRS